ncbi:MAG: hypothetical protein ACK559_14045, partial [bacterium]
MDAQGTGRRGGGQQVGGDQGRLSQEPPLPPALVAQTTPAEPPLAQSFPQGPHGSLLHCATAPFSREV